MASVIRLLTKDGSDCKAKNNEILISLFHAINEGSLDAVREQVEEVGESLDISDKYCKTAIDNAKRNLQYARNDFPDNDYINQVRECGFGGLGVACCL
jgi:hypothetical protein